MHAKIFPVVAISLFLILFSLTVGAERATPSDFAVLVSPKSIIPGQTVRVLVASEKPYTKAALKASGPSDSLEMLRHWQGGGPPYWWTAEFVAVEEGIHKIWLEQERENMTEKSFSISNKAQILNPSSFIWKAEHSWTRQFENLYAAWIERLFLDKEEGRSWDFLHHVMQDAESNLLHNYLGLDEDGTLILSPDCADNPFFFRAYFAWKLGLPYGHHVCDRGTAERAPRCDQWTSNHAPRKNGQGDLKAFQSFTRTIKNIIHSGSARTSLSDNDTDLYPLPLQREHLHPGVVFADPFGHTLMIGRWIPQTEGKSGQLLAVDAQPDGTIGVRRFWQGQFLFATDRVIGEPGFKAFRPIVQDNGKLRTLTNQEIIDSQDYGNFSLQQHNMNPLVFYDSLDRLINPLPLDPVTAFRELHDAVQERLQARAKAVANGETYMLETNYEVVPMPSGARIFQTSGPWEDFSTPARDMRLLIALDVLMDFPNRVLRNPEAFSDLESKKPEDIKIELADLHRKWAKEITITYVRSDGMPHTLTLTDILSRLDKLEMAYNPNDGVEIRWGASEGSEEFASCQRRAPVEQRQRMESYRKWLRDRMFPIR